MKSESVAPATSGRPKHTTDIKCLECGAFNIPDNLICGACGASLPIIYGQDGKVFNWEKDSPYWANYQKGVRDGPPTSPATYIAVRALIILALFVALGIVIKRFDLPPMGSFIGVILILTLTVRLFVPPRTPN